MFKTTVPVVIFTAYAAYAAYAAHTACTAHAAYAAYAAYTAYSQARTAEKKPTPVIRFCKIIPKEFFVFFCFSVGY